RDVQWVHQVEAGSTLLAVQRNPGSEVRPQPGDLGDEPLRLRGDPDLEGHAPLQAALVPDEEVAPSIDWVHHHSCGGHPHTIDLSLDHVANLKFTNHSPTLSFRMSLPYLRTMESTSAPSSMAITRPFGSDFFRVAPNSSPAESPSVRM